MMDTTVSYPNLIQNAQNPVTTSEDNATEMLPSSSAASMNIHMTEATEADIMDMTVQSENDTSSDVEEKFFVGSVADFGLDEEDHNLVDKTSLQLEQDSCIRIVDVTGGTQLSTSSSPDSSTRKRKATHDSELCCAEEASDTSGEVTRIKRIFMLSLNFNNSFAIDACSGEAAIIKTSQTCQMEKISE
jgi:hypothetical protein